jgi:uncharacterized protein YkwD
MITYDFERMMNVKYLMLLSILLLSACSFPPTKENIAKNNAFSFSKKAEIQNVTYTNETPIAKYMGATKEDVLKNFGQPVRIDPTAYKYEWYVYNQSPDKYIQFGILDDKVVTIAAVGKDLTLAPFTIGDTYEDLNSKYKFTKKIQFGFGKDTYRIQLTDEDMKKRPIIKLDSSFVQLNFDTFTDKLSSIRFVSPEILLLERPFDVSYTANLPKKPELSDDEWVNIENATEKEIFDISNVYRIRNGLKPLVWDDKISQTAYNHSKDMSDNEYFDHVSPTKGSLKDRLQKDNIAYHYAGENIASGYIDSLAVTEAWLNSEGHRKSLLDPNFIFLGVGVYKDYYTQDFYQPLY